MVIAGYLPPFIGPSAEKASEIEQAAGMPARKIYKPMQAGDMVQTMADTARAQAAFGYAPTTPIETGLPPVVAWCRDYFGDAA